MTQTAKHTPGPRSVINIVENLVAERERLKVLNAELLAALETVMDNWKRGVPMDDRTPTGHMVADAIAKAEGR